MHKPTAPTAPRRGSALVGVGAIALVAASVVLTDVMDLAPCPLCIFQRMLYLLLGILTLTAAVWPRLLLGAGVLALVTSVGGLATAVYQSWMQAFPAATIACGPGKAGPIEQLVYWAGNQVPWLFTAWGDCSSREWELLGLSIANWSAVAFLGFSVVVALLLRATVINRRWQDYSRIS